MPRHKTSNWIHSAEQQLTQLTAELEEDTPDADCSCPEQALPNSPKRTNVSRRQIYSTNSYHLSGRWQAPAAVLPPEGWQRGRGPEGPEDKGHGHSRAREWPKHASPRARRARGRTKLSARLGACQCYYMFFTTQLKIAKFMGRFQDLNVGQKS